MIGNRAFIESEASRSTQVYISMERKVLYQVLAMLAQLKHELCFKHTAKHAACGWQQWLFDTASQ